jgi:hypothetical protein
VLRDPYILRVKGSETWTTKNVWIPRPTLWEFCYLVGSDLAKAFLGRLDGRIKAFGEPIGRLTEVEIGKARL